MEQGSRTGAKATVSPRRIRSGLDAIYGIVSILSEPLIIIKGEAQLSIASEISQLAPTSKNNPVDLVGKGSESLESEKKLKEKAQSPEAPSPTAPEISQLAPTPEIPLVDLVQGMTRRLKKLDKTIKSWSRDLEKVAETVRKFNGELERRNGQNK